MSGSRLNVSLVVQLDLPAGASNEVAERAWVECFRPLIGAVHHTPDVRLGFVLDGELIADLQQRHPEGLQWLRALLRREQIELLGTALHGPVLTAVPERDAVGQCRAHVRLVKQVFGTRPRGAWVPHGIWDPVLPRIFAAAGLEWTLLDERVVHGAVSEAPHPYGAWFTEREGARLGVLPFDHAMLDMAPNAAVKQVLAHLARRARAGDNHVMLVFAGNRFGLRSGGDSRRDQAWFATFLAALTRAAPKVVTMRPSDLFDSVLRRGRVYISANAPKVAGVPWERHLVQYPEAARLHQKLMRVSRMVDKLDRLVKHGAHTVRRPDPSQLEQAHRYLYRAQAASVLWHADHAGLYDASDRRRAWRDVLRAERVVLEALKAHQRLHVETDDVDFDGHDEVVLRTPTAAVVITPSQGAAVTELSVLAAARNLVDTVTRRREPYHDDLIDGPDEVTATDATEPYHGGADGSALIESLAFDDQPRTSFCERLIQPEVEVWDFAAGRVQELIAGLGTAPWQVVDSDRRGNDAVEAIFARDVRIRDDAGEHKLTLHKKFRLRREPTLHYRLEVINRSHTPARARLAVEFNLDLGAERSRRNLVVAGRRQPTIPPRDVGEVDSFRLEGPDTAVDIDIRPPGRLWCYPLRTVHRHAGDWQLGEQGTAFVVVWPIELWEQEKARFKIDVSVST